MAEIYGHKWSSQYGDCPSDTWRQGIDGLAGSQLAHGLRECLKRTDPWPPNLAEFRQMCTGDDGSGWERQCHKHFDPATLVEDITGKEKRRDVALDAVSGLRDLFGSRREA